MLRDDALVKLTAVSSAAPPAPVGQSSFIFGTKLIRLSASEPATGTCGCCGQLCSRAAAVVAIEPFVGGLAAFVTLICPTCAGLSAAEILGRVAHAIDDRAEPVLVSPDGGRA
jgi:hypothetical protein